MGFPIIFLHNRDWVPQDGLHLTGGQIQGGSTTSIRQLGGGNAAYIKIEGGTSTSNIQL